MITPVNVEGYDECLCVCVVISRVSVIGLRKRLGVAVRWKWRNYGGIFFTVCRCPGPTISVADPLGALPPHNNRRVRVAFVSPHAHFVIAFRLSVAQDLADLGEVGQQDCTRNEKIKKETKRKNKKNSIHRQTEVVKEAYGSNPSNPLFQFEWISLAPGKSDVGRQRADRGNGAGCLRSVGAPRSSDPGVRVCVDDPPVMHLNWLISGSRSPAATCDLRRELGRDDFYAFRVEHRLLFFLFHFLFFFFCYLAGFFPAIGNADWFGSFVDSVTSMFSKQAWRVKLWMWALHIKYNRSGSISVSSTLNRPSRVPFVRPHCESSGGVSSW